MLKLTCWNSHLSKAPQGPPRPWGALGGPWGDSEGNQGGGMGGDFPPPSPPPQANPSSPIGLLLIYNNKISKWLKKYARRSKLIHCKTKQTHFCRGAGCHYLTLHSCGKKNMTTTVPRRRIKSMTVPFSHSGKICRDPQAMHHLKIKMQAHEVLVVLQAGVQAIQVNKFSP